MNLRLALEAAPPTPACFPDRMQWAAYLLSCQGDAKREPDKPFKGCEFKPEFKPEFNFCADCDFDHRARMADAGKCAPHVFRIAVVAA